MVENFPGIGYQTDLASGRCLNIGGAFENITGYRRQSFLDGDITILQEYVENHFIRLGLVRRSR